MKITNLDKPTCREIREALQTALDGDDCDLEGVTINVGNATYQETTVTFKVEVAMNVGGRVMNKRTADYGRYAMRWGLPEDGLGKTILINREEYEIVGLKAKARKKPLIVKRAKDGKEFVCSANTARVGLGAKLGTR